MEVQKRKIAVGYCRVSTENQAQTGISIETQEAICLETAEKDGYEVLKIIKDEGKSGGSLKRGGIQEVIKLVVEKKIDAIYTIHSDRIARNTLDHLQFRELLRNNNVILKCIYQPMFDDSATSRVMDTMVASFNEMQRLITGEKVKATLYNKVEAGYFPAPPPPGYKNVNNPDPNADRVARKIVVVDTHSGPIIQEIFKLYATGDFNVYDLSELVYEKGLRSQRGIKMSPSRIYDLLKNRFYLGEVKWGEAFNKNGKHPPLIDEITFNHVQVILDSKNHHACRRRKYQWLLNGFLYCEEHKKRYTAEWHLNKKLAYYHCSNKSGCGRYVEQTILENKIAEKFTELQFSEGFVEKIIEKTKEIFYGRRKVYEKKRQGLVNQRTAIEGKRKVAEDKLFEKILSDDDFARIRKEIHFELSKIDEEIVELEFGREVKTDVAQEVLHLTRNIYDAYTKASPHLKRQYLGFFWERFELRNGVIIKSVLTPLFDELLRLEQMYVKDTDSENLKQTSISNGLILSQNWLRG